MIRTLCTASAALLLAACAPTEALQSTGSGMADAAKQDIPDVAPGEISIETMKQVVETISSDAFEGRFPGTKGEDKTLAYLVEKFAAAGLQPGNHGSWFQDVPLVEITGENYAPLVVRGGT